MSYDFKFTYDDVIHSHTPREVTRASFWRLRSDSSFDSALRDSWGAWVDVNFSMGDLDLDAWPDDIRRHLPTNRKARNYRSASIYWRPASETFPEIGQTKDDEDDNWRYSRLYIVPEMPRSSLLELSRRLEVGAAVHAREGRGSEVSWLSTDDSEQTEIGRDRVGELETLELVESLLAASLPVDDPNFDCYLADGPRSWAVAMGSSKKKRDSMHEKVRAWIDTTR